MELAMVGLGRMGFNMATRLLQGNHRAVAWDLDEKAVPFSPGNDLKKRFKFMQEKA